MSQNLTLLSALSPEEAYDVLFLKTCLPDPNKKRRPLGFGMSSHLEKHIPDIIEKIQEVQNNNPNACSLLGEIKNVKIYSFPCHLAWETVFQNKENVLPNYRYDYEPGDTIEGWKCLENNILKTISLEFIAKFKEENPSLKIYVEDN